MGELTMVQDLYATVHVTLLARFATTGCVCLVFLASGSTCLPVVFLPSDAADRDVTVWLGC